MVQVRGVKLTICKHCDNYQRDRCFNVKNINLVREAFEAGRNSKKLFRIEVERELDEH